MLMVFAPFLDAEVSAKHGLLTLMNHLLEQVIDLVIGTFCLNENRWGCGLVVDMDVKIRRISPPPWFCFEFKKASVERSLLQECKTLVRPHHLHNTRTTYFLCCRIVGNCDSYLAVDF